MKANFNRKRRDPDEKSPGSEAIPHVGDYAQPSTDPGAGVDMKIGAVGVGKQGKKAARTDRLAYAALAAILAAAGVLYALGIKLGLVHDYYSAAVYSMSKDWSSFLWGSVDGGSITVDKLPGALWIQALSVRLFGFNDLALLGPQLVESLLAVVVVFFTVRRWVRPSYGVAYSNVAGLLAAAGLATTPIVAALAHAEISDTLLMPTLSLGAYAWTRAMEKGSWKWLAATGFFVGWAFQAKMAEAWGIVPALALAYLLFAPGGLLRRVWHVLVAGVSTAVFSLWWLVLATITPADARPWIDGSANNSAWAMVFDYNLSGRYDESGAGGGNSWSYLFGENVATQAGWFYAAAVVGLIVCLWYTRKAARTDLLRAATLMAGAWFAIFFVAFSVGKVMHSYYVIAFAPAVVMLAAVGAVVAWRHNKAWVVAIVVATVGWASYLMNQFDSFYQTTVVVVLVAAVIGLVALFASRRFRFATPIAAAMLAVAALATPAVWSTSTTSASYAGSAHGPAAGPVSSMGGGSMGGGSSTGSRPSAPSGAGSNSAPAPSAEGTNAQTSTATSEDAQATATITTVATNTASDTNTDDTVTAAGPSGTSSSGRTRGNGSMTPPTGGTPGSGTTGSMGSGTQGGPGGGSSFDASAVLDYIRANNPGSTYDVVVTGYSAASEFITNGGHVIFAGGYSGSINNLTLDSLRELITNGEVHYIYLGGGGRSATSISGSDGTSAVTEISSWVQENCQVASGSGTSSLYVCTAA